MLWTAKDVFLDLGFERTSMDVVASRAATSKRSLYAHFASKEKLFLAVVGLVRGLFLARLGAPGDYGGPAADALTAFCGRYLEILLHEGSVQMMRVSMAESRRFPEGAAAYFDVMFAEVHARLSGFLQATSGVSGPVGDRLAQKLLGQILHPRLPRALLGLDELATGFDPGGLSPDFDLGSVRDAVADLVGVLPKRQTGRRRA